MGAKPAGSGNDLMRVRPVGLEEATGKAKEMYDEIQEARGEGKVTYIWRAMAINPEVGYHFWQIHKLLMAETGGEGKLDRKLREKIALMTSLTHECKYCMSFHSSTLDRIGLNKEETKKYIEFEQGKDVDIPEHEKKLLSFVKKVAIDPHKILDEEVDEIRALGYDDKDLVEIMQILMLFVGISRFVGVLQIGAAPDVTEPWLQPYTDMAELKKWNW